MAPNVACNSVTQGDVCPLGNGAHGGLSGMGKVIGGGWEATERGEEGGGLDYWAKAMPGKKSRPRILCDPLRTAATNHRASFFFIV